MGIRRLADRAVGRHRAPREPTVAVEEARERNRVAYERVAHLDAEDLWARLEREAQIAVAADVHTGHTVNGRERTGQHVDRGFAVEQRVAATPGDERRLVEEQHDGRVRELLGEELLERDRPRTDDFRSATEREALRHPCGM